MRPSWSGDRKSCKGNSASHPATSRPTRPYFCRSSESTSRLGFDAANETPFADYSFRLAVYSFKFAVISFFDTLTLRPALVSEAPDLALLSRELIEQGLSWRYTPRRMAHLMAQAETSVVVACDAQCVQGFGAMHFGEHSAHLVLLCVRPEQQGCGIGCGLLEWLMGSAQVAGMARVALELRADNCAALAFYRHLGFEQALLLPDYYDTRVDARRMLRILRTT